MTDDDLLQRFALNGDDDAFELDEDADDRAVFHHIATLLEVGDLWPGEGWNLLRERYPDEPGFRILATARLAEQHGISPPVATLEKLLDQAPDELVRIAQATAVIMTNHGQELVPFVRARGIDLELDDAYRIVDEYEWSILVSGEERTRNGRPWKDKPPAPLPLDYAGALERYPGEPRAYSAQASFDVGQRIEHKKFGLGVVIALTPGRIGVLFPTGRKTLVAQR